MFTNYLYAYRVIEGGRISKLRLGVGTTSAGNICVAVFDSIGEGIDAKPNNRKATSPSIPCPAINVVATTDVPLDITVDVITGDWLVIGCDNTSAGLIGAATGPTHPGLGAGLVGYTNAAGAFPAPPVFPATWYAVTEKQIWLLGIP